MNVVEDLHNAVKALLTTEAAFLGALTTALGAGGCGFATAPGSVLSNRPLEQVLQLGQEHLPCWLLETLPLSAQPITGHGEDEHGLVIGVSEQAFRVEVGCGLVWHNESLDNAYLQRLRIPNELVRLFLRRPDAGVAGVNTCVVADVEPDQGVNHPNQVLRFVLAADIVIPRE